jgi:hypothetical protein
MFCNSVIQPVPLKWPPISEGKHNSKQSCNFTCSRLCRSPKCKDKDSLTERLWFIKSDQFKHPWVLYLLTSSRSWALLEEPPIVQPLKNFPAFYGTRRFNTVFTRALHWSLSWAISIHTIPSYLKSILILSITPPQNMTFHDEFGPKNEVFRFKKVMMTCDRGEFNVLIKFFTSR